ncbi:hypothetical protein ACCY16_04850 [Candidatus Pantoea formicae]|uniref:hypothetical protein n=1 Tax=Candidatus Pantoea formicae TaxID=2608355 RepID=UPI003ED9251A
MVRAVLEGRKTQTRRICSEIAPSNFPACLSKHQWVKVNNALPVAFGPDYFCSRGAVGDRLWVRECWSVSSCFDDIKPSALSPLLCVHYMADGKLDTGKKRPSIHMPHWASRITLEINGFRVERLQGISEAGYAERHNF